MRYGVRDALKEFLPGSAGESRLRAGEFWALDRVSLELRAGEALAVLGHNGAGKSTLLKLLYGLLKPDAGEVRIHGRLAALIELGTGFHPLLSGRENIELGAALLGLDSKETAFHVERAMAFAELGDFIDAPLQSYSSGMRARLSYAVAALLSPDILLVDEVLAVGDAAFQRKCIGHMHGFLKGGGALVLVSHNIHHIQAICTRGIVLDKGRIIFSGSAVEAVGESLGLSASSQATSAEPLAAGKGPVAIEAVRLESAGGGPLHTGEDAELSVHYRADEGFDIIWGFSVWTADGWVCITSAFETEGRRISSGCGILSCTIPSLALVGGRYMLKIAIADALTFQPLAQIGDENDAVGFAVEASNGLVANFQRHAEHLVATEVLWKSH